MATKHLFRSDKNKILAGICGGVGEYFNIDPSLLRLVWILIVVFTGIFPGVVAYLIAILVIPPAPQHIPHEEPHAEADTKE